MRFDEKSFLQQAIIIIISTFTRDQIGINFPYQEKPNKIKQNQQTFFFFNVSQNEFSARKLCSVNIIPLRPFYYTNKTKAQNLHEPALYRQVLLHALALRDFGIMRDVFQKQKDDILGNEIIMKQINSFSVDLTYNHSPHYARTFYSASARILNLGLGKTLRISTRFLHLKPSIRSVCICDDRRGLNCLILLEIFQFVRFNEQSLPSKGQLQYSCLSGYEMKNNCSLYIF